jgi:DNA repair photolyase
MLSIAELQRAPDAAPDPGPASLPLRIERVRTFSTPEFAGMRFLEVEAKSALNRVRGMPFEWSINPYRGCSHACSYCLAGDTPILLADGRTKPLAEIRPGDAVYGTEVRGAYRRYVATTVLDHWSTIKPAYRIALEDGTELVASGDHRFLTDRGWKHVTPGADARPALTPAHRIVGTGGFAPGPADTAEYRRGYLCGLVRADLGLETLRRARRFRDDLALPQAVGGGYTFSASAATWPRTPSADWCKGFLAGLYDTAGRYAGTPRLGPLDDAARWQAAKCLRVLGFAHDADRDDGVRLLGGLREHLRFFSAVDPAETGGRTIERRALAPDATVGIAAISPLGVDMELFDLTTGTGDFIADGMVSHNCFARPSHQYLNLSPLGDFEKTVVVKTNVAEVLRRELARPTWTGAHVAMGTNTDPYQRCEGRYRLMTGVIRALAEGLTPFSILTKGTLVTRDLDVLRDAAGEVSVSCALTVGMLDRKLWKEAEPGTPSPLARLDAVARLNAAGIPTGVMLAPIMPGLNDEPEALEALVDAAAAAGATHITPIVLHLRRGVRELFWPWLERFHPELVERYAELYRGATAAAAYRKPIEDFVAKRRRAAWARHGRPDGHPSVRGGPRPSRRPDPAPDQGQLRLL